MRKPDHILYGPDDTPPARLALLLALQQAAFLGALLVVPSLFAHHQHLDHLRFLDLASATLLVSAAGLLLQVLNRRGIGSGYYYPMQVTTAALPAMYFAATGPGGLAASYGMVAVIGITQFLCGLAVPRLRAIFTTEVAGLAVLLVGVALGQLGVRLIFEGSDIAFVDPLVGLGVAALTFLTMVGCNVWLRSRLRLFATLIGLAVGALAGWLLELTDPLDRAAFVSAPWLRIPELGAFGWHFEPALIVPYALTGVFLTLASIGTQAIAQQATDADWRRPDLRAYDRGLRAEGLTQLLGAAVNAMPLAASGGAVVQAAASGSTSRRLAYWVAALLVLFALLPKLVLVWLLLPDAVVGGLLLFLSAFSMISGMQLIGSRLLDNRRVIAIGAGLAAALAFPSVRAGLQPLWPRLTDQIVFSGFSAGMVTALALTALLRLGVARRAARTFVLDETDHDAIARFIEHQARQWGERREVARRAELACWQTFDLLAHGGFVDPAAPRITIETRHDEFSLLAVFTYRGELPPFDAAAPAADDLLEDATAQWRLAAHLVARSGRLVSRRDGAHCTIEMRFAD